MAENAPVVAPTVGPAEQAAATAELRALNAQPGWLAKATAVGANTPESNQYQELIARKAGHSRSDFERIKAGEVTASRVQPQRSLPTGSEAIRTQFLPGAPGSPGSTESVEAGEPALIDLRSQEVPKHIGVYRDVVLAGKLLPAEAQAELKMASLEVGLAATEHSELWATIDCAQQGKVDKAAVRRLSELTPERYQRVEQFARAGMARISRQYPELYKQLVRIPDSSGRGVFEKVAALEARLQAAGR